MSRSISIVSWVILGLGISTTATAGQLEGTWQLDNNNPSLISRLGGNPPFTTWGKSQYRKNLAAASAGSFDFDQAYSRCSSPGLPRLMLVPQRFKILEENDVIIFLFEWNRLFRQIDLRAHPYDSEVDSGTKMIGQSTGTWQGKTLAVTTHDLSDETLLDNAIAHSDEMTINEQFQLASPDRLEDTVTLTDPKLFIRPVTFKLTYHRVSDALFAEDVCLDRKANGTPALAR